MTKETRLYACPVSDFPNLSYLAIDKWNENEVLPDEANEFIEYAEENGAVYSLDGLQHDWNLGVILDIDASSDFIFITNKYPI